MPYVDRFSQNFLLTHWGVSYLLMYTWHTVVHYQHGANAGCDLAVVTPVAVCVTLHREVECWRHRRTQVAHSGEVVLVWAGMYHRNHAQLRVIVGSLNVIYCAEILCPTVLPFARQNNTVFQHDNIRPHIARICRKFLGNEREHYQYAAIHVTQKNMYRFSSMHSSPLLASELRLKIFAP